MLEFLIRRLTQEYVNQQVQLNRNAPVSVSARSIEMPRWRSITSFRDPIRILKPGFRLKNWKLTYKRQTDFIFDRNILVRAPMPCIVIGAEITRHNLTFKDADGSFYHVENIEFTHLKPGDFVDQYEVIGMSRDQRIAITYYDVFDRVIRPITECLLDR